MYNNVYQEYINDILGTVPKNQVALENDVFRNSVANVYMPNNVNMDLERLYPELYKLLYPMIQSACMRNTKPLTEETIQEMVTDIYSNFNADDITIASIVRNSQNPIESQTSSNNRATTKNSLEIAKVQTEPNTRANNYVLNDLIRILLIRELLGRPESSSPIRPIFPPPRPGFGRPPKMFRESKFDLQDSIYENPIMY